MQPGCRADDIHDRVQRADFMEMHLFHRHSVDARLDDGQPGKRGDGVRLHPHGQTRAFDQFAHVGQVAVLRILRRLDRYQCRADRAAHHLPGVQ